PWACRLSVGRRMKPRPGEAAEDIGLAEDLRRRAHRAIPGGCHTYAKGDDQYPVSAPAFIVRGKGCRVWDLEGREYIEYAMGLRAVTLGHAYQPVLDAAIAQMQLGANFNRPSPIEVECAEALLSVVPRADMVKFAKDGSTAVSAAVKLARAHTGRGRVAICVDHPFFSYNDWFIATTGMPGGIPEEARNETVGFHYNDLASVERVFRDNRGEISCVVLEPARSEEPQNGFLASVRECAHRNGALLVFDETITGFRWAMGGAQEVYDVEPDLSIFGKALGNGFSVSALVGKREYMQLGGLEHTHERVFLLSTTHGAETHALAAAKKVIEIYRTEPVIDTLYRQGARLEVGVRRSIAACGLEDQFILSGRPCALLYGTRDQAGQPSQAFRALFLQELLKRGVLAPSLMVSYTHDDAAIDATIEAIDRALEVYRRALDEGVEKYLVGRPLKPVYRRFN
ncbi:MAG: glutamate-1-semialdehyde 2,1-aminomutase, partial [Burkholderiaceae bacterium]